MPRWQKRTCPARWRWVLGSEGGGPGALTRKLCDAAVTLEMAPGQATGVDSYNVSVAAGILCYDVMRRRLAKK